jgi:hypothetical protein
MIGFNVNRCSVTPHSTIVACDTCSPDDCFDCNCTLVTPKLLNSCVLNEKVPYENLIKASVQINFLSW